MKIETKERFTATINGRAAPALSTFEVVNPATEEVVAYAPDASAEQLDEAVASARAAAPLWAATSLEERRRLVTSIGDTINEHLEALALLLTQEQGKPVEKSRAELQRAAGWCAETAKIDVALHTIQEGPAETVHIRYLPLGVTAGIVPWNFPIGLAMWKIAPALLTGNTMVLKPSPFTPLTTLRLGELLRGVLPAGVLNVISGTDALGPLMSTHPGINKISFTGSTLTGRKVMASAASNLKRLTLELGGNDAAIVLPDVDVESTAHALFWGAFANSGQVCLAIKRLYIHQDIYDRMAEALARLAVSTKVAAGTDPAAQLGPVQNRLQFARLQELLEDTSRSGYRVLAQGTVPPGKGYFFPVTLIDNPPDHSRVVQEEAFGPLLPLLRFSSLDEVVDRANATEFGLGASVWSKSESAASALGMRLECGTVCINQIHANTPLKPMAGHKQSGVGVENGVEGLLAYTSPQTISVRRC